MGIYEMTTKKDAEKASERSKEALSKLQESHLKRIEESLRNLNERLINASTILKTDSDGLLVSDKVGFAQAQRLHEKIESLYGTEFTDQMKEEINKLSAVKGIISENLSSLGESAKFTSLDDKMMEALKDSYYADFASLSATNKERVVQAMYNQVISGASYSDLIETITGAVTGLKSVTGRPLETYAKTYARDMTMNFHNSVMMKKAEDGNFNLFLYSGTLMSRSRKFCIQRAGKVFTKKDIQSWTYKWAGKSGPAFTHRGGYNCRHHWQPVKKEWLSEEELKGLNLEDETPKKEAGKKPVKKRLN